ncbi:Dehydration-responsive element-binding protein 2C [Acorus calamus]|uniref:Dehydration-responsive element-binding protein 2C n=1 Tax=Acorus calamus TaxID=4465 RepID=A0AAV9C8G8_ACOCL|nr:Dehydration-responsive element-binding protein 2C [Acorus calamus]
MAKPEKMDANQFSIAGITKMRKRSRRNNSLEDVLAEWEQQHHNHLHISNNNGGNPIQKKQAKGSKRGCMKGKGGPENSSCTYRVSETTTSASHRSDGSSDGSAVSDNVDDELFDEELERALLMEIGDDEAGCGEQKRARLNLPLGLTSVSEISTSASHHSDGSAGSDDVDDGLFDEELERALLTEIDDDEAGCGEQKRTHLNLLPLDSTSVSETTTTSDQHSDCSIGSGMSEQTMQMYEALGDDRFVEELEHLFMEECGKQELRTEEVTVPLEDFSFLDITIDPNELAALLDG